MRTDLDLLLSTPPKHPGKKAVHALRTASRRLRLALGAKPTLSRDLKKIARRLSALRDRDAVRALLQGSVLPAPAQKWAARLRKALKKNRHVRGLRRAQRRFVRDEKNSPLLPAPPLRLSFADLLCPPPPLDAPFAAIHARRKIVRRLRYALEMTTPSEEKIHRAAKEAQKAYGDFVDWQSVQRLAKKWFGKKAEPLLAAARAAQMRARVRAQAADARLQHCAQLTPRM